jgi:hypothetical protein
VYPQSETDGKRDLYLSHTPLACRAVGSLMKLVRYTHSQGLAPVTSSMILGMGLNYRRSVEEGKVKPPLHCLSPIQRPMSR